VSDDAAVSLLMQHHFVRPHEDVVLISFQESFISCPSSRGNGANANLPENDEVRSDGRIVQRVVPHLAPVDIQSSDCGTMLHSRVYRCS
jgi:hypothetical protein